MKLIRTLLPDVLMLAGTAAVSYGAWLVYEPAGYIVAGAITLVFGVLGARASEE